MYEIKDWAKWYEKSHKETERAFSWVAVPTRHDGKSFRRLMRLPDGMALFAAFILMLEIAAKMPVRGLLADEDGPLDAQDMADATGGDPKVFARALKALTDDELKICWLLCSDSRDLSRQVAKSRATGQDSTGQDKDPLTPADAGEPGPPAEKRKSPKGDEGPAGFTEFWTEYPNIESRKRGKAKCRRKWERERLEQSAAEIVASLRRCKASRDWREGFVPLPMTWLNDTPWLTDPADAARVRDPGEARAKAQADSHRNVAGSVAEKRQAEAERQQRIAILGKLSPERLASLKRQCIERAEPSLRARMEAADPMNGHMLAALMVAALKAEEMAGVS